MKGCDRGCFQPAKLLQPVFSVKSPHVVLINATWNTAITDALQVQATAGDVAALKVFICKSLLEAFNCLFFSDVHQSRRKLI